jgi:hypothetical protein
MAAMSFRSDRERQQQLEDRVSTIENVLSSTIENQLSSFRAECEARQKLEERVKKLEELVRSNENLVREADNIISEAEARLPAQEPAEEQKQEEAQEEKFLDQLNEHIFDKAMWHENINSEDLRKGGLALTKIKEFLDMSYGLLNHIYNRGISDGDTIKVEIFKGNVDHLMAKLGNLTNWSTEEMPNTEEMSAEEEYEGPISENVVFQFPGDTINDVEDIEKVDKEIQEFWDSIPDDFDDELTDDQKQQLYPLLYKKEKLVRDMRARRIDNRRAYFVTRFGLQNNPTPEEINNETMRRLNETLDGTDTQLERLADHIEQEREGPDPRPDLEAEAIPDYLDG